MVCPSLMESAASKRMMSQIQGLVEARVSAGVSSLLDYCRFDRETELHELGYGNLLMLLCLEALAEGDSLLLAVTAELSRGFAPLASTHLADWLRQDFDIPPQLLVRAQLHANSTAAHIPSAILNLLGLESSSLAETIQSNKGENNGEIQYVETVPASIEEAEKNAEEPEIGPDSQQIQESKSTSKSRRKKRRSRRKVKTPKVAELEAGELMEKGDSSDESGEDDWSISQRIEEERQRLLAETVGFMALKSDLQKSDIEEKDISGFDLNYKSLFGETALHAAAKAGNEKAVRLLLDRGSDIDAQDPGNRTALHFAVYRRHFPVVKVLVERGADVNTTDLLGISPLRSSLMNNDRKMAEYLQANGAFLLPFHTP